jgi:hypothetical protein
MFRMWRDEWKIRIIGHDLASFDLEQTQITIQIEDLIG